MGPGIVRLKKSSLREMNKTGLELYHSSQSWEDNQVDKSSQSPWNGPSNKKKAFLEGQMEQVRTPR